MRFMAYLNLGAAAMFLALAIVVGVKIWRSLREANKRDDEE